MVLFAALIATVSLATSGCAATAWRSAADYAGNRVELKCEEALAAGEQLLVEEHGGRRTAGAEAAEDHFRAALKSLGGFGSSRVEPVVRHTLESRARDGCARACLHLARPSDAVEEATKAADAACRAGDDALRRSACGTLCDALLEQTAECVLLKQWSTAKQRARAAHTTAVDAIDAHRQRLATDALAAAFRGEFEACMASVSCLMESRSWADAVTAAREAALMAHEVDGAAVARAASALAAARLGQFEEQMDAASALLQQRRWDDAQTSAQTALRFAPDAQCKARAKQAVAAARRGLFDDQLAVATAALQQRLFSRAVDAAHKALGIAPDDATAALASAALATARAGACDAHLNAAAAAGARGNWTAAQEDAHMACSFAPDAEHVARADAALRAARAGACDAHLTASTAAAQQQNWTAALREAEAARRLLADDDVARAPLVTAALAAARIGAFDSHMTRAAQAEEDRRWAEALTQAQLALDNADGDEQRQGLARAALARAHAGPCNAHLAASAAAAAQQNWAAAQAEAQSARARAPDAAHTALADAAWLAARAGACDAHLATSAAATQRHQWPAALREAEAARHLLAASDVARAALVTAALAAARLGTFNAHMASSAQALAAQRWKDSATQAQHALENADNQHRQNLARNAIEHAHAAAAAAEAAEARRQAARRAAEAAEPGYVTAVDECIRAQFKFTGHDPCSFRCPIATIAKKCRKPDVIPGTLAAFLQRHPEAFKVSGGATVSVTRLTPFRGGKDHRVFGEFRCSAGGARCNNGRRWKSGNTFCDTWQRCQGCETETYPFAQRVLERREDEQDNGKPHDSGRCGRCLNGHRCTAAILAERAFGSGGGGQHYGGGGSYDYDY
jgi:hypothetical protein